MELQRWNKKFCNVFLLLFCLAPISCKKQASNDLIVFDVNGNFPVKILDIQDIADIEYLVLDANDDDYLFAYFRSMTDNVLICTGGSAGRDFLFFDRTTGKPAGKVSRYGQGPGEYNLPVSTIYSEAKDEFFILDWPQGIKVYARDGTFKRQLPFNRDLYPNTANALYDYDEDHLLLNCFSFQGNMKDTSFLLISKQDGVMDGIRIVYEKKTDLILTQGMVAFAAKACFAVRNGRDYLLTDYSSDTVYRFTPERELIPVLARRPSIQKMETKILLHSWLETSKYLFFSTDRIGYDGEKLERFPTKGYLMEKSSGKFFQTNIQMRDYKGKGLIIDPSVIDRTSNQQTGIIVLTALELHKANEENKLDGKLKEVTDRLTEDDEYVFMILKVK